MADTRTGYIGTHSPGDVLTSANLARSPGGMIGYVELASDVTAITTEQDVTGLAVVPTLPSGRRFEVKIVVHTQQDSANQCLRDISVDDGAARMQIARYTVENTGVYTHVLIAVLDGDDAAHDLQVRAAASGAGSPMDVISDPAGGRPCLIMCTDVGPTF